MYYYSCKHCFIILDQFHIEADGIMPSGASYNVQLTLALTVLVHAVATDRVDAPTHFYTCST